MEIQQTHDSLQSYVLVLAKILLVAGLAILAITASIIFETYIPDFAEGLFFILYILYAPLILIFGCLAFVVGFVVPAIVYTFRYFSPNHEGKSHLRFVAFVLVFFSGVFVITFFVPYNLV